MNNSIINKLKESYRSSLLKRMTKLTLVWRIKKFRCRCAVIIQKNFRGYIIRKELSFLSHPKVSLLVKWPFPANSVRLAGDFSQPPWSLHVPLQHSKALDMFISTFFLETRVDPGRYYMKFIVDGEWVCSPRMATAEDLDGNLNNVLSINKDKRYVPRAHSTRNLLPDVSNISKCLVPIIEIPRVSSEHDFVRSTVHRQDDTPSVRIKLVFGSYMAAHPKNRFAPLEAAHSADACLVDEELQVFGVADGVGEWETFGLDSGMFPKELMQHFKTEYSKEADLIESLKKDELCAIMKKFLEKAFKKTESYGSSTVLLGLCRDNEIFTVCIGDSAFTVFRPRDRKGKLNEVFRSVEQQHSFNCPFQLACFPDSSKYEELNRQGLASFVSLLKRSNLDMQDSPADAETEAFPLKLNDIIIAATDGLFDNLFTEDLIKITEMFLGYDLEPKDFCERLARELVQKAVQKGWDTTYRSPFSKNAARFGQRYIGGKLDDTTVIVAVATAK